MLPDLVVVSQVVEVHNKPDLYFLSFLCYENANFFSSSRVTIVPLIPLTALFYLIVKIKSWSKKSVVPANSGRNYYSRTSNLRQNHLHSELFFLLTNNSAKTHASVLFTVPFGCQVKVEFVCFGSNKLLLIGPGTRQHGMQCPSGPDCVAPCNLGHASAPAAAAGEMSSAAAFNPPHKFCCVLVQFYGAGAGLFKTLHSWSLPADGPDTFLCASACVRACMRAYAPPA